ncbi:LPXTG cell wall anchor domain-containing protein, partial [Liquorilactobacillus satsumensis]
VLANTKDVTAKAQNILNQANTNLANAKAELATAQTNLKAAQDAETLAENVVREQHRLADETVAKENNYKVVDNKVVDNNGNPVENWKVVNGKIADPYGNTITASETSADNSVKAPANTNYVNFTTTEITKSPVTGKHFALSTGKHFVNGLNKATVLPQAGESDNSEATTIGLLLSSIAGVFGLGIQRKKTRD